MDKGLHDFNTLAALLVLKRTYLWHINVDREAVEAKGTEVGQVSRKT